MSHVLITGGSGFLGSSLIPQLTKNGHVISLLSRNTKNLDSVYHWDPSKKIIDVSAFEKNDTIIHLAGASISDKPWTKNYKRIIQQSRSESADLLFETLKNTAHQIKTFISASAIGYYGNTGEIWVDETSESSDDFMGETCLRWENSAHQFESIGIRVVIIRIGIVLATDGGALPAIIKPVKFFAAAPFGSGKQFMSWIHIADLVNIFSFVLENKNFKGVYNAVAPVPVTNKTFIKTLGKILNRPVWPIHIPEFILRLLMGERANLILFGQRVSSEKLQSSGYMFLKPDLTETLSELTGQKNVTKKISR